MDAAAPFPVRCMSCGTIMASVKRLREYERLTYEMKDVPPGQVLTAIGIQSLHICPETGEKIFNDHCRKSFISGVVPRMGVISD